MAAGVAILATVAGAVTLTQQVAVQPTLHLAAYSTQGWLLPASWR
jgi:hypothetical protein